MTRLRYPLPYYIRTKLGLLPWKTFREKAIVRNLDLLNKHPHLNKWEFNSGRATGRTTRK